MGEHCRVELDHVNTISFFPRPRLTFWTQLDRRRPGGGASNSFPTTPTSPIFMHHLEEWHRGPQLHTHTHRQSTEKLVLLTILLPPGLLFTRAFSSKVSHADHWGRVTPTTLRLLTFISPHHPAQLEATIFHLLSCIYIYTHIYTHITIIPILVSDSAISMNLNNHLTFFLNQFRVLCCRNYPCLFYPHFSIKGQFLFTTVLTFICLQLLLHIM